MLKENQPAIKIGGLICIYGIQYGYIRKHPYYTNVKFELFVLYLLNL